MVNQLLPIKENAKEVAEGNLAVEESVDQSLQNISETNHLYNAIIWQDDKFIKDQINSLNIRLKSARIETSDTKEILKRFPLLGVPITVKEIDSPIRDTPNSWGNKMLKDQNYKDTVTATSVKLIQEAGAIIVGKTNNPEFALPIVTYSTAHGPSLNPLDTSRNTGGSSGGAAACVAAGMTRASLGGDGGGSIRVPSSNCGLWGIKPSRGRISSGPFDEYIWSGLASKGVIANSLEDLVTCFDVLAQPIQGYKTEKPIYSKILDQLPSNLKISVRKLGLADAYPVHPAVSKALDGVLNFLSAKGHQIEEKYPEFYNDEKVMAYQSDIIAHHTLEDFNEAVRRTKGELTYEDCDPLTQWFLDWHNKMESTAFDNAISEMESHRVQMDKHFEDYDILITPTCADVAPKLGYVESDNDGVTAYIYAGLTLSVNMTGNTAISVPVKTDHETGLPVGIQIIAKRGQDDLILQLASLLEKDYSDIYITDPKNITN